MHFTADVMKGRLLAFAAVLTAAAHGVIMSSPVQEAMRFVQHNRHWASTNSTRLHRAFIKNFRLRLCGFATLGASFA